MASSQENEKITSRVLVTQYDFDPDSADAQDVAWVDMRDFGRFLAGFFRTVGTSDLDTMKIIANSESDGSGTDVEVKSKTLTGVQPNAVGDYNFLECTAQELAALGTNLRYVTLQLEFATATDEGVVTYIRSDSRFSYTGLTADSIA